MEGQNKSAQNKKNYQSSNLEMLNTLTIKFQLWSSNEIDKND